MQTLQRLLDLLREDLIAILPGSAVSLDRAALLRLVLYGGLVLFFVGLATLGRTTPKDSNPFGLPMEKPRKSDLPSGGRSI